MKITLAAVLSTRLLPEAGGRWFDDYLSRIARYTPCESQVFESEKALLEWIERQQGRTRAYAVLVYSRGQQYSSEEFAGQVGRLRDEGTQRVVFAIGPADGWSAAGTQRAALPL